MLNASVMVFKNDFGRIVLQTLFLLSGGVLFPSPLSLPASVEWLHVYRESQL